VTNNISGKHLSFLLLLVVYQFTEKPGFIWAFLLYKKTPYNYGVFL
tara:strand:- start:49 stop:186 length:138 start_codon:yes stop_codon:yes gene_type:complete